MNISKRVSIISLAMIMLLVACGTPSTDNTSPTINLTDVNSTAQSAAVTLFAQTMAPTSTSTVIPTDTPLPPVPSSTPPLFKALEGLRVAYISNGNLYVQDSGGQPVQLISNVANRRLLLSDDGQKIVFHRGVSELWVIEVDGTEERAIATLELLMAFSDKYNEFTGITSFAFIPSTHNLIFNTGLYPAGGESHGHLNKDLFFVNTDTGEIKQLRAPDQGGNFLASPDGKKIAVQTIDHVDVIDMQGKLLLGNLVARPPIDEYYGISWTEMSWTPDSKELIILPSKTDPAAAGIPIIRMVWRFPLDGSSQGIEIKLNPPPSDSAFSISPDGNWIAYTYTMRIAAMANWLPELVTWDSEKPVGIYLGNLRDGTSKLICTPSVSQISDLDLPTYYYDWSPDSTHFIVEDYNMRPYIGDLQGEIASFPRGFVAWIDTNRYLLDGGILGEIGKQSFIRVAEFLLGVGYSDPPAAFVFLGH